jgi:hypothetical protein
MDIVEVAEAIGKKIIQSQNNYFEDLQHIKRHETQILNIVK